jgi:single-stranded-DNA-specific exonuclease
MLEEFGGPCRHRNIGDIVPLHGENRLFAKMGIEAMNTNPRTGVARALLEVAGIKD